MTRCSWLLCIAMVALPTAAMAQPGPNDATSQGSGRNRTGEDVDRNALRDEDGSPSKGFVYERADGSFALNVRTRVQVRAAVGGAALAERDERLSEGLTIPRARLVLQGYAKKVWLYRIQVGAAPADLSGNPSSPLLDAHVTWAELRDVRIRVGQMRVPFDRQNLISATALQTVSRSVIANELGLGRDIGALVSSNDLFGVDRKITYAMGVFGGKGPNRVGDLRAPLALVRLELSPLGDFDATVEADLDRRTKPKLALALAVARQWNAEHPSPSSDVVLARREAITHLGLDAKVKWLGVSVLVQGYSVRPDHALASAAGSGDTSTLADGVGGFAQAGYMLTKELEVAARSGVARGRGASDFRLRENAAAVSYYVSGNDIKVQLDVVHVTGGVCTRACTQGRLQVQMSL